MVEEEDDDFGEKYRYVDVNSSSAFSHVLMLKVWKKTKANQRRVNCGMWPALSGLMLYANISIHGEFAIHCHYECAFDAPVIWTISFPAALSPFVVADNGTVSVCEMVGETFDRDWIKLMTFSDLS